MRLKSILLGAAQIAALCALQSPAVAQDLPACSWPLETTGSGITNVAYPDTNATYWTMPFDANRWKTVTVTGTYPESRFFSFVSYVAKGAVADGGDAAVNDVDINPDAGSTNPFQKAGDGPHQYTVTLSRTNPNDGSNFLPFGNTKLVWLIYRIYVPNKGLSNNAGVPLPTITVTSADGRSKVVPACPSRNNPQTVNTLSGELSRRGLIADLALLRSLLGAFVDLGNQAQATCQATPLVSWIPENTGGYFPNPANKYIAIPGLCFQPNRVLVVRGKAPIIPDTYDGGPIWKPRNQNMRYWSMCNNNQRAPYPVVACKADFQTNVDRSGYYTYVLSLPDSPRNPDNPPSWIPSYATWLPWGSKTSPNILLMRNMLPKPNFKNSVQNAISKGCVVDNERGNPPSRDAVVKGGDCAENVMQDYYPEAAYCSRQVFINEGWKGCFAAAKAEAQ
jgi:hypothetical protein